MKRICVSIIFILIFCMCYNQSVLAADRFVLTINKLPLEYKERIVGFEIKITAGGIVSMPRIPMGWDLAINNDPTWNTKLVGSVIVGAAALQQNSFTDFVIIDKNEFGDLTFAIKGEVITTKDFVNQRHIVLEKKYISLKKIKM